MKRTRRISIEIEHREVTLHRSAEGPACRCLAAGYPECLPGARLTLEELAARLQLSPAELWRRMLEGELHFHRDEGRGLVLCGLECLPCTGGHELPPRVDSTKL